MTFPAKLLEPIKTALAETSPVRWPIIDDEAKRAVMAVLDRGILSGSFAPESMAFEAEFAEFVGTKHALFSHSGTSALVMAVAAAGVEPGDEVLVPAYTFVATSLSVIANRAHPVFVDVDPRTGCMTRQEAEKWVSSRTRAILPVHVHGCPADLDDLGELAASFGGKVIEDAAQAHGATYRGQPVGGLFSGGAFSMQSSKNFGCGEGGLYVTNHDEEAELALQVRNFGQDLTLAHSRPLDPARPLDGSRATQSMRPGGMYRGNEMTAALARVQLRKLRQRTEACQKNAARLSAKLASLPGLEPPFVPEDRQSVHHKFRLRFDTAAAGLTGVAPTVVRDALLAAMLEAGFEAKLWERAPQPSQQVFRDARWAPKHLDHNYRSRFPATRQLLESSLLLFSQSCPLIAQDEFLVDRYAEAFAMLWDVREQIVAYHQQT